MLVFVLPIEGRQDDVAMAQYKILSMFCYFFNRGDGRGWWGSENEVGTRYRERSQPFQSGGTSTVENDA